MPESDPVLTTQRQEVSLEAAEEQYRQSMQAYRKLVEKGTPWLFDVGTWIFGGLIAFTLLIMASLITVGPVDLFIKIATASLALALPLDVTGLVLLRLVQDMEPIRFEETVSQTFQEAGLTPDEMQVPSLTSLQAMRIRGTQVTLRYAVYILALSIVLTLAGMVATLWYMAWWIGVAFAAMVVFSVILAVLAMAASQPPVAPEEKRRRKAYRDELIRQAKERTKQEKKQKSASR